MGFFSMVAYGAGRMAGRMGDSLREERQRRTAVRQEMGMARFRAQEEMRGRTLAELFREQLPSTQANIRETQARTGLLDAQAAQDTAQTEALPYANETARIGAEAQRQGAQNAARRVEIDAAQEARLAAQANAKATQVASQGDVEAEWLDWTLAHPDATPDQKHAEAQRLRLNTKDHPQYRDWFNAEWKPLLAARTKNQGGARGPQGPGMPPTATGQDYAATGMDSLGAPVAGGPGPGMRAAASASAGPLADLYGPEQMGAPAEGGAGAVPLGSPSPAFSGGTGSAGTMGAGRTTARPGMTPTVPAAAASDSTAMLYQKLRRKINPATRKPFTDAEIAELIRSRG